YTGILVHGSAIRWGPMNRNFLWVVMGLGVALTSCVLSTPPPRNSRYGVDLTQMTKSDVYPDTWMYRHPTKKTTDYSRFLISPVSVYDNPSKKVSKKTRADLNELAQKLTEETTALMAKDYTLVKKPGPGVLRMDIAIVDIKPVVHMINEEGN